MILLTDQTGRDIWASAGIFGVMLVVFAIVFLLFLSARAIERILGDTGILVVTRLLGMLLAASRCSSSSTASPTPASSADLFRARRRAPYGSAWAFPATASRT